MKHKPQTCCWCGAADRMVALERLVTQLERDLGWCQAQLSDARAFWDSVHADTRRRVAALEQPKKPGHRRTRKR